MKSTMTRMILIALGSISIVGCSASTDDVENQVAAAQVAISGQFNTSVSGASLSISAINDFSVYCLTLQNPPTAASGTIAADGTWAMSMPSGVSFGCFIVNASNTPVATIMKTTSTSSNFAASQETSFAISGNLDMGAMTLDLDSGKVEVPATKFADVESTIDATPALDLDGLHDKSYAMSCVTTGNTVMDAACAAFVTESPAVYFRILKGTESGAAVKGMGVWASSTAFSGCGSIDMLTSEASDITGVTFSQNATGASYTADDTTCGRRDNAVARTLDNLTNYYAVAPLAQTPSGWNFIQNETQTSGSCTSTHYLSLNLSTGSTAATIQGSFDVNDTYSSGCSSSTDQKQSFVVTFTPST